MQTELSRLRDAYIDAFNRGDMEQLEALLHPRAEYRWVAAGRSEVGREQVMTLYRRGHQAFGGASRLSAVPDTEDAALWWEPTCTGLQPRGLQHLSIAAGQILEIADEHAPERVAELARDQLPPR